MLSVAAAGLVPPTLVIKIYLPVTLEDNDLQCHERINNKTAYNTKFVHTQNGYSPRALMQKYIA